MSISLIVAAARNGVIGREGDMPWHLSDDLRRFKRLTMGHCIVMGRRTYESIGRPLPGRQTVVLTRQTDLTIPDVTVAHGLDNAIQSCASREIFIVGGGEIYALALPLADRIYLTRVQCDVDGDTYFPEFDKDQWQCIESQSHPADDRNDYATIFETWQRRDGGETCSEKPD